MNTAKPIATISFNTEPFLRQKLGELLKARKIEFWAYIHHEPEDDETNKPHCHVYVEPSKRTQTAVLKDEFKEYDPAKPEKPLGVLNFGNSKFGDWYMYALHDPAYLASKMETRRHHYAPEHVQASDPDELRARIYTIDMSDLTPIKRLQAFQESGKTFGEAVASGVVPIAQIRQFETAWQYLTASGTDRNGRPGHPEPPESPKNTPTSPVRLFQQYIDPDTGEVRENEVKTPSS